MTRLPVDLLEITSRDYKITLLGDINITPSNQQDLNNMKVVAVMKSDRTDSSEICLDRLASTINMFIHYLHVLVTDKRTLSLSG